MFLTIGIFLIIKTAKSAQTYIAGTPSVRHRIEVVSMLKIFNAASITNICTRYTPKLQDEISFINFTAFGLCNKKFQS